MTKAASAVAGSERRSYFRNLTPLRATPTYAAVVLLRRPGGHADRPRQARSKFARALLRLFVLLILEVSPVQRSHRLCSV